MANLKNYLFHHYHHYHHHHHHHRSDDDDNDDNCIIVFAGIFVMIELCGHMMMIIIIICSLLLMQYSSRHCGQSMSLWQHQKSLDGEHSSQDVGASEESDLLQFFNPYVARKLTNILLKASLDESKCSHYNWNC